MRAEWQGKVVAEAPKESLIQIEGNWYFPPDALHKEFFEASDHHTECHWKGHASYYTIVVGGERNQDAAWFYAEPKDGSTARVGKDFTNYVAFWRGVAVSA